MKSNKLLGMISISKMNHVMQPCVSNQSYCCLNAPTLKCNQWLLLERKPLHNFHEDYQQYIAVCFNFMDAI